MVHKPPEPEGAAHAGQGLFMAINPCLLSRRESWSVSIYCMRASNCAYKPGYLHNAEGARYISGYFTVLCFKIVQLESSLELEINSHEINSHIPCGIVANHTLSSIIIMVSNDVL